MKRPLILLIALLAFASSCLAQGYQYVPGYYRHDGTYVQPHYQTNPDGNAWNNWSTKGNYSPFTGKPGYVDPYAPYNPYNGYRTPTYNPYNH